MLCTKHNERGTSFEPGQPLMGPHCFVSCYDCIITTHQSCYDNITNANLKLRLAFPRSPYSLMSTKAMYMLSVDRHCKIFFTGMYGFQDTHYQAKSIVIKKENLLREHIQNIFGQDI